MKAICSKCGLEWGVSIHKDLNKPFVCPRCQFKRNVYKMALFLVGFLICCLLVPKFSDMAYQQRGSYHTGSEVLVPLLYVVSVGFIRIVWRFGDES